MNIPTKLITTTIDEFKAEGYEATRATVDSNAIVSGDSRTQIITLEFAKTEEGNS